MAKTKQTIPSSIIEVEVKNKYGNDLIYPVCEKALTFAHMLKQTTLTKADIANIRNLGFEITVKQIDLTV